MTRFSSQSFIEIPSRAWHAKDPRQYRLMSKLRAHLNSRACFCTHLDDFTVPEAILIRLRPLGDITNHVPEPLCILALRDGLYGKTGAGQLLAILHPDTRVRPNTTILLASEIALTEIEKATRGGKSVRCG